MNRLTRGIRACLVCCALGDALGDTIAAATKMLGIEPCRGCQERRAALNGLVPYSR
jgi:hypothetical protein